MQAKTLKQAPTYFTTTRNFGKSALINISKETGCNQHKMDETHNLFHNLIPEIVCNRKFINKDALLLTRDINIEAKKIRIQT